MAHSQPSPASRMALIDACKGIAAQLIVLHHLAFYGPMSDVALPLMPDVMAWLYDYGRIAVQAFLVMGGFLAARGLAPQGVLRELNPWAALGRRYVSLVFPFAVALLFAILGAALARQFSSHASIPAAPEFLQVLAHLLLLHNIVGADALSAGVWYVAIDFQLYALLLLLLVLARSPAGGQGRPWLAYALVAALGLASLLWFNRQADLDIWGIYFFGAYALGAFAYWASQQARYKVWLGLLFSLGVCALLLDFRLRIAVALVIALLLAIANRGAGMAWPKPRLFGWLGQISYAVFLVHFPVCLLVNVALQVWAPASPGLNLLGMVAAWGLSLWAGQVFYRRVECRVRHWRWPQPLGKRWALLLLGAWLGIGVVLDPLF